MPLIAIALKAAQIKTRKSRKELGMPQRTSFGSRFPLTSVAKRFHVAFTFTTRRWMCKPCSPRIPFLIILIIPLSPVGHVLVLPGLDWVETGAQKREKEAEGSSKGFTYTECNVAHASW